MLIGLLRLRFGTGKTFGLGRVLWKQVRWLRFSFVVFQIYRRGFFVRKGLIWLLLAIVFEIPPTVRPSVYSVVP